MSNRGTITLQVRGEVAPVTPPMSVSLSYGRADTSDSPVGTAEQILLSPPSYSGDFRTPMTTSAGPRWYFELPPNFQLVSIQSRGIGGTLSPSSDWRRVGGTQRYVNQNPITGFAGNFHIAIAPS